VLDRRRVYVFPSRQGLAFTAALGVMLLGAINYDNSLAYALTFLLGSLLPVCILHTWRNLAGLRYAGGRAGAVFAGGNAAFELVFDNRGHAARPAIIFVPRRRRGAGPAARIDLAPDTLCNAVLELPAPHRGRLSTGRLRVSTVFPLGLVRAWAYLEPAPECIVYPAPAGPLPLPEAVPDTRARAGSSGAGNDDFLGFRAYRPGDPPRSIAWKALARGQPLLVKRFAGSGGGRWLRLADTAGLGGLEPRLGQLCRWVLECEGRAESYGLELPGTRIPPASGTTHRDRCLRALALFEAAA